MNESYFSDLGHLYMIRAFLPPMLEMNHGSIVAIAAVCGHMGMPNMIPYAASKFGVRGMMESLYIELRWRFIEAFSIKKRNSFQKSRKQKELRFCLKNSGKHWLFRINRRFWFLDFWNEFQKARLSRIRLSWNLNVHIFFKHQKNVFLTHC